MHYATTVLNGFQNWPDPELGLPQPSVNSPGRPEHTSGNRGATQAMCAGRMKPNPSFADITRKYKYAFHLHFRQPRALKQNISLFLFTWSPSSRYYTIALHHFLCVCGGGDNMAHDSWENNKLFYQWLSKVSVICNVPFPHIHRKQELVQMSDANKRLGVSARSSNILSICTNTIIREQDVKF